MRLILLSLLLLLPALARAQASNALAPAAVPTSAPARVTVPTSAPAPVAAPTSAPVIAAAPSRPVVPAPAPAGPSKAAAPASAAEQKLSPPASKAQDAPEVVPTVPAANAESPDARFDKTGDGLVDAADWALMTEKEKRAYARASLEALGEDPDAPVGNGKTRLDLYLDGLRAVYH